MRYDYKIQCPNIKCSEIFVVNVDSKDSSIIDDLYPTHCPNCGKKIKVKVIKETRVSVTEREAVTPSVLTGSTDFSRKRLKPHRPKPQLDKGIPFKAKEPVGESKRSGILTDPGKRLKLAFILLIIVFILGLSNGIISLTLGSNEPLSSDEDKPKSVDIQGQVIDYETGRPIEDCRINIKETGQWTTTDSSGHFFISNVEVGEHEISAKSAGYTQVNKKVTVDPELLGTVNFEIEQGVGIKSMDESVEMLKREGNKVNTFAVIIIIFAIFALLSAILVKQRNLFYICAFSAFLSILSFGVGVGLVLGLIATSLILLSKSEFDKSKELSELEGF